MHPVDEPSDSTDPSLLEKKDGDFLALFREVEILERNLRRLQSQLKADDPLGAKLEQARQLAQALYLRLVILNGMMESHRTDHPLYQQALKSTEMLRLKNPIPSI